MTVPKNTSYPDLLSRACTISAWRAERADWRHVSESCGAGLPASTPTCTIAAGMKPASREGRMREGGREEGGRKGSIE